MASSSNGFCVKPRSINKILSELSSIRNKLYPENPDYLPIEWLLEKLDGKTILFNHSTIGQIKIHCVEEQLMKDAYGKTFPRNNENKIEIHIKDSVYIKACEKDNRARFTIAHEIAHAFLHGNEKITFNQRINKLTPAYCDSEWQANTGAAFLLLPPDKVEKFKEPKLCSQHCGISIEASKITIKTYQKKGLIII
ncbi:hypothetical protein COMNV_01622 [Commensalibacter sp. Nvir]|uniref:ImmA/IrrE family metallo-endopeptidase n=1 Tax=Commensalibacter sp. Nvir TaxID=3069817 RepID=UPI002D2A0B93|nr:hypothetical protein COMNV_01622 [Commensalibacter sp. Nvir]